MSGAFMRSSTAEPLPTLRQLRRQFTWQRLLPALANAGLLVPGFCVEPIDVIEDAWAAMNLSDPSEPSSRSAA
jgi:hypothetical protein